MINNFILSPDSKKRSVWNAPVLSMHQCAWDLSAWMNPSIVPTPTELMGKIDNLSSMSTAPNYTLKETIEVIESHYYMKDCTFYFNDGRILNYAEILNE